MLQPTRPTVQLLINYFFVQRTKIHLYIFIILYAFKHTDIILYTELNNFTI